MGVIFQAHLSFFDAVENLFSCLENFVSTASNFQTKRRKSRFALKLIIDN